MVLPITLTRVDFRLIHGQVVTQWVKRSNANEIIIIDTALMKDPFMREVFEMAAPKGVRMKTLSTDQAVESQREGKFDNRRILILFKSVQQLHEAVEKGLELEEVQIGGLGGGPDRKPVNNAINLNREDADWLLELQDKSIHVYLQTTPDYPKMSLDNAVAKL